MYPIKTIVICHDEKVLPGIRRELLNANAELDGIFPNVQSVVQGLTLHHDEMRLFVLHLDSSDDLEPLNHLSGVFAGRPIIVLFDENPSASVLVNTMREGAAQVVLMPFQSDDFQDALRRIETQFGHATSKTRLIAVTGSHGGAGATTIAVNLAYEVAQKHHLDCILLELSSNVGVLSSYLDIEPKYTLRDLLEMEGEIDVYSLQRALVPFGDRLAVLTGPRHVSTGTSLNRTGVLRLIQAARQLADVVILDVPCTLNSEEFEILDTADIVVLVAEQTVPSIQLTCESLRLGIRAHAPVVVMNRFDQKREGFEATHLAQVLGVDHVRTVSDDHDSMIASINSGRPLRLAAPHSRALVDIDLLADDLLGKKNSTHLRKRLFSRIAHALGVN